MWARAPRGLPLRLSDVLVVKTPTQDGEAARPLLAAGRAIVDHDVRSDLAHVKVPAMVVVGSADRLTPVAQARVLADSIPGSVLRVLPGVGHQTMQEDPVRFAELVDELSTLSP